MCNTCGCDEKDYGWPLQLWFILQLQQERKKEREIEL